jgi:hypothetical protein
MKSMSELLWALNGHPSVCHLEYQRRFPEWRMMRDCVEGQTAIHDMAEVYLPKRTSMEEDDYRSYLLNASFFNATGRTLQDLMTRAFRRPPVVVVPDRVDVDNLAKDGRSFRRLCRDTTKEVLSVNRVGLLLDMPRERQVRPKPFVVQYSAEDILSWSFSKRGLESVLLMERKPIVGRTGPIEAGKVLNIFSGSMEVRCRLLALDDEGFYYQLEGPMSMFEKMMEIPLEGRIYPDIREKRLDYIPFYIFSTDGDETPPARPILLDIAHKNLSHYRNSARLAHARHFVGSPIYVAKYGEGPPTVDDDQDEERLSLSSDRLWEMAATDDAKILQFMGNGLETLENALNEDEQQMRVLGARLLMQGKGTAARSSGSDDMEADSHEATLQDVIESVSRGMETLIRDACEWLNVSGTVMVQLNRQFTSKRLGPRELRAIDAAMGRSIPVSAVYYIMKESGWIGEDMTLEEYEAEVREYLSLTSDKITDVVPKLEAPKPTEKKEDKSKSDDEDDKTKGKPDQTSVQ